MGAGRAIVETVPATAGLVVRIRLSHSGMISVVAPPDDIRLSFNDAAEIYDEARPTYPSRLFDDLFDLLPPNPWVIEVGPGTGQATKDLLLRGASVHAIEIGAALARKLRSNLPTDRLQISVADFETLAITKGADALFSATAYHWISPEAQTGRPAEILRTGGVVAIVDLIQVDSPDDLGFFSAAQPIYDRFGAGHTGPVPPARDDVDPKIHRIFSEDSRFTSVIVHRFDWNQTYSVAAYRSLMLSYSGTQMMNEPDRLKMLDEIGALIRSDFAGTVTRPLVVTLTTAILT